MWTTTLVSGGGTDRERESVREGERVAERTQRHKATAAPKKCWGTHIDVEAWREPSANQRPNPLGVFGQGIKYNWCWALRKCSLVSSAVDCNGQQATSNWQQLVLLFAVLKSGNLWPSLGIAAQGTAASGDLQKTAYYGLNFWVKQGLQHNEDNLN